MSQARLFFINEFTTFEYFTIYGKYFLDKWSHFELKPPAKAGYIGALAYFQIFTV